MRFHSILCATLLAPFANAQNITASLEALTPITASWVGAPAGTPNATVTHPAGPLTNLNLSTAGNVARFSCNLSTDGDTWTLAATSNVWSQWDAVPAYTQADLLLTLTAPAGSVATLSLEFMHQGDFAMVEEFQVDVGNDGSFELDGGISPGIRSTYRNLVLDFTSGTIEVRIKNYNALAYPPTFANLNAVVREWSPHATHVADGCGGSAQLIVGPNYYLLDTNYALDAVPPDSASGLAKLRARGFGQFAWFCAAADPTVMTFQLPPPIQGTCPLLANILITDPGTAIQATMFNIESAWVLEVPSLPPGFEFYMQHASASLLGGAYNSHFGTSNIIRIDT